ncbi:Putative endosulphine [Septoria linicola]|uniref:mRNA stability protein n=1 Tax=Septoria linicola TaxID=215465 RepID=A0A9Q9EQB2_9PEZI|nr:Putative endosulphine [Septoria linicola]
METARVYHDGSSSTTSIVTREADRLFCRNHDDDFLAATSPFDSSSDTTLLEDVDFSHFIVDLPDDNEPTPRIAVAAAAPRDSNSNSTPPSHPLASAEKRKPLELLHHSNRQAVASHLSKERSGQQTTKTRRDLQAQASLSPKRPRLTIPPTNNTTPSFLPTMALNPHKQNKVDVSSLTEEEQKLFRLYGKLPNKKDLFSKKLQERKYFDSGDYAMSKAGKSDGASLGGGLGREHPTPENIPHLSQQQSAGTPTGENGPRGSISGGPALHPTTSTGNGQLAGSPVKEASLLHRGSSVDEDDLPEEVKAARESANSETAAIPIRQ